jgi:hypothetical protein
MSESSAPLSYATLHHTLASIRQKLSKNKRTLAKVVPQVTSDMEQLIFALKQHNMHSISPSSRIAEAQAWTNKAVIDKAAGRPEDEAQSYLCAANIWFHLERERKSVNFPTTDDCLARGVSCCAMACSVLLSQKPHVNSSPLPRRMATKQQIPNLHLSRCWAVCMKVASVLTEFHCLEMAADYYELSAIVVTSDPPTAALAAAAAAGASASGPSSSFANNGSMSGSADGSAAGRRTPPPPQANASFASIHTDPAAGGGAPVAESDRGAMSPARSAANSFGRSTLRHSQDHWHDENGSFTNISCLNERRASVVPGLLANYLVAMVHAAQTCCLVQDYPRALTMADEVLLQLSTMEQTRRPIHVASGWGPARRSLFEDPANVAEQPQQAVDPPSESGHTSCVDSSSAANPPGISREGSSLPTTKVAPETQASGHSRAPPSPSASPSSPCQPSSLPEPLEHLHWMLETEFATIQMRIMKFLLLLIVHDKKLTVPGALEQVAGISLLAQLYARHERTTRMPEVHGSHQQGGGGAVARALRNAVRRTLRNQSRASDKVKSQEISSTAPYISALMTLQSAMEIMLDVHQSYVTSSTPMVLENVLAQAVEEMHGALARLGARTRDVMILIKRAEHSILRSNVSLFQA